MKLVFDFAGVIFHWSPQALIRRELPRLAVDDASAERWLQLLFEGWGGDWREFDRGRVGFMPLVQRIALRTGLAPADVERVMHAVPQALQPHAPTVALLQSLREQGHRLYYLSNMPEPYAARLVRDNPFLSVFEDGVISARVQAVKPEREIFEIAARRFGAVPGELLFFDDVAANVDAARACGWRAELYVDAASTAALVRQHAAAG